MPSGWRPIPDSRVSTRKSISASGRWPGNPGQSARPRNRVPVCCANGAGELHEVTVTDRGYAYRGIVYTSLTAVAIRITGTRWSGPRFFGTSWTNSLRHPYPKVLPKKGLAQAFNSLSAQRELCEAYIHSQKAEGWIALPAHYDDGGISGGTLARPALRQLLEDIEQHKVDQIIVYRIDRLTRSLSDFAKLIDRFDAHDVSMVSVSQPFDYRHVHGPIDAEHAAVVCTIRARDHG